MTGGVVRAETILAALGVAAPVLIAIAIGWANISRRLERISESLGWIKRELRNVEEDNKKLRTELHRMQIQCAACSGEHSQRGADA